MNLTLVLLIIFLELRHETTKDVEQIQQTLVLENCVEDAQKKREWGSDAGRYSPVKGSTNALLPSCDRMEIQAR